MKKIIYRNGTGIAIITPSKDVESAMKDIPKGAEYKIVDESELPKDRELRNAWNYDLKEDITKSKEIWKDKLRVDRKPLLKAQDVAFLKALEDGKSVTAIKTEKKRLRDITLKVDSVSTISALKKVAV